MKTENPKKGACACCNKFGFIKTCYGKMCCSTCITARTSVKIRPHIVIKAFEDLGCSLEDAKEAVFIFNAIIAEIKEENADD